MKKLILLRHAKSEELSFLKSDFERNLKPKGIQNIHAVADAFGKLGYKPDIVLCSSANRTRETLKEFQLALNQTYTIQYLDELYHAAASDILKTIQKFEKDNSIILLLSHNMGISQLAFHLGDEACNELPTSGLLIFQFENDIQLEKGKLLNFLSPKTI